MRTHQFTNQQHLINEATKLYIQGNTTNQIARTIGKSRASVSLYLKHVGIKPKRGPKRVLALDESFFEKIDTHIKAYWLGFLLADGHIPSANPSIRCSLKATDISHLEQLLKDLQSGSSIKVFNSKTNGKEHLHARVALSSSKMKSDLVRKGWYEFKKTGDVRIVRDVPDEFKPSLMRGLFDGDGCFMTNRASFIDMHLSVVTWFQETLVRLANIRRATIIPCINTKRAYTIRWAGRERLCAIRGFLYSTPGPLLQRKKDVADKFQILHPESETVVKQKLIQDGCKWCPKCKSRRERNSFSKSSRAADGLYPMCKQCWNTKRATRFKTTS